MATAGQVIKLYEKILELLKPLGMRVFGWSENGSLRNGGDLGLDNMRSEHDRLGYDRTDNILGRFFYTGLGSGLFVPEKIRGGQSRRGVGSVPGVEGGRGFEGLRGALDVGGIGGMGGVLGMGGADVVAGLRGLSNLSGLNGLNGARDTRNARSEQSAWSIVNYWERSAESTALNAAKALLAESAANAESKPNALNYRGLRIGESLEKQLNGKQILGTNTPAPIDRSWEITRRAVSVTEGLRGSRGEQNGSSGKIKTGAARGTRSAVSENEGWNGSLKLRNAVSAKITAESENGGFEENAERAAVRGSAGSAAFGGRESGETARLGASGGRGGAGGDTDDLIDRLCGAFREAAFSMSEGVHY